jgi:hypothetical protein
MSNRDVTRFKYLNHWILFVNKGCNMIQIFESLDLALSNMHVSCFKHVISVMGSMAHTSHL